jgi:type I restriction enzyme M protein
LGGIWRFTRICGCDKVPQVHKCLPFASGDWWEKREGNEVAWKVTIDDIKARNYNLDFKNLHTVEENHGDPAELLAKLEENEAETAKLRDRLKAILEEALLR